MERVEFNRKRREMTQNSIEDLIDLLADENLQTRFFAEMCLRDATST